MALNCTYKTVTLQPNEPFNLPPGAEIISATNINALTSSCPLSPNLEPLECWVIYIGMTDNQDGGEHIWMYQAPSGGVGITVADVFYAIEIPQGAEGQPLWNSFVTTIQANPQLNSLLLDIGTGATFDDTQGGAGSFCFRAPASIGANTYITWNTTANGTGMSGIIQARFYAVPRATFTGTPACECASIPQD